MGNTPCRPVHPMLALWGGKGEQASGPTPHTPEVEVVVRSVGGGRIPVAWGLRQPDPVLGAFQDFTDRTAVVEVCSSQASKQMLRELNDLPKVTRSGRAEI